MASVTLEKVSKFYGNVEAVKKINLEIKDNEFLKKGGDINKIDILFNKIERKND